MSGSSVQMQQDDRSTSIKELTQGNTQQTDPNMVNNIMNTYQDMELNESEDNSEEIYDRQMMNDVNEPSGQDQDQPQNMQVQENMQNSGASQISKPVQPGMVSQLVQTVKAPLIVMVVFFVLNQGFIINMINSSLMNYLGEESNYNMYGLIFRSVLSAILFYAINHFS